MKKKLFIPDIILIDETIEKYGYDPNELIGTESYNLLMVCTCKVCNNKYDQQYASVLSRYLKNKKCKYCSNGETSRKNASNQSKIMKEKVANGSFIPPMLNKNHSKETKNIISKKNTGNTWEKIHGKEKTELYKKISSERNSGIGNPMYGTSIYELWKKKYGEEKANELIEKHKEAITKATKRGKDCNFYGKKYWPKREKLLYNNMYFRSNWEILVVKYLELNNIKWEYEPKYFDIDNSTSYTPDFYLPEIDKWLEVKGYWHEDAIIKFEKFKILYPKINIEVWDGQKLKELKIIK